GTLPGPGLALRRVHNLGAAGRERRGQAVLLDTAHADVQRAGAGRRHAVLPLVALAPCDPGEQAPDPRPGARRAHAVLRELPGAPSGDAGRPRHRAGARNAAPAECPDAARWDT